MYNILPSRSSKIIDEQSLGNWCSTQRRNYKDKFLSNERITQLNTIPGWKWDILNEIWDEKLIKLKEFGKMHNKLPSEKSKIREEKLLGGWCGHQRSYYRDKSLNNERITQLNSISIWYWSKDEKLEDKTNIPIVIKIDIQDNIPKVKPKNNISIEKLQEKYKNLSSSELLDLLIKKDIQEKSGYQAPNPISKDQINKLFSNNIHIKNTGYVIVLDDIQFNSSKFVNSVLKSTKSLIIPNNSNDNLEMSKDITFGKCVKKCSLQELLNDYIIKQIPIKAIYADLMGSLQTEINILNQIKKCNLVNNCIIGFTVSARSNIGADYTNEYATNLLNTMYKTFTNSDNLVLNSGIFVYGSKVRMATCIFKVNVN